MRITTRRRGGKCRIVCVCHTHKFLELRLMCCSHTQTDSSICTTNCRTSRNWWAISTSPLPTASYLWSKTTDDWRGRRIIPTATMGICVTAWCCHLCVPLAVDRLFSAGQTYPTTTIFFIYNNKLLINLHHLEATFISGSQHYFATNITHTHNHLDDISDIGAIYSSNYPPD